MVKKEQKSSLLDKFPKGFTPTEIQVETLQRLQKAFDSDKKFIIICAPTGSGKSFLSKTLANATSEPHPDQIAMIEDYSVFKKNEAGEYMNADDYMLYPRFGGFVLTITKQLQEQYHRIFSDAMLFMGKSNYQCQVDLNYDVETAPCVLAHNLKNQCWVENKCHYYVARNKAIASKFGCLNYKMFLSLPEHVRHRNIIICDEASELEEELVKQFSAQIRYDVLDYLKVQYRVLLTDMPGRVNTWLSELLDNTESNVRSIRERSVNKLSEPDKVRLKLLMHLQSQISSILDHWTECEYIIEKDNKRVSLTPLKVDKVSRHIFSYADKVVLLSATIIDPHAFAKNLGITDFEYIEVKSTFDPAKSPIYISQKVSLNFKNLKESLPYIASQISGILLHHSGDKGIIHTHTNDITLELKRLLSRDKNFPRLLFREKGASNKDILEAHIGTKEPTVLVSPSMSFGVDLAGDLGRFCIICKAPYLPLGDKRIKMRYDDDKVWFQDCMLKQVVQAAGRTTRSVEDFSSTYILDGHIGKVVLDNREKLPAHFLNRIH